MVHKIKFSLALLILINSTLFSFNFKGDKARQAVYFEFLGNGLLYTLNYEREVLSKSTAIRIGTCYINTRTGENKLNALMFPLMFNYLVGSSVSKLELGFGPVFVVGSIKLKGEPSEKINFEFLFARITAEIKEPVDKSGIDLLFFTGTIGYRYQPKGRGIIFRIGYTPVISKGGISSWIGLSVGYKFN